LPVFDDPNLTSSGGLAPALALADRAGLRELADEHLTLPTDKGPNAGLKAASLVARMVAGADLDRRHGAATARRDAADLHKGVRPVDAGVVPAQVRVRSHPAARRRGARFLIAFAGFTALFAARDKEEGQQRYALLDIDDTVVEVHGHAKQGAGFGYNKAVA